MPGDPSRIRQQATGPKKTRPPTPSPRPPAPGPRVHYRTVQLLRFFRFFRLYDLCA